MKLPRAYAIKHYEFVNYEKKYKLHSKLASPGFENYTSGHCYKTFYGRKLRLFIIS